MGWNPGRQARGRRVKYILWWRRIAPEAPNDHALKRQKDFVRRRAKLRNKGVSTVEREDQGGRLEFGPLRRQGGES